MTRDKNLIKRWRTTIDDDRQRRQWIAQSAKNHCRYYSMVLSRIQQNLNFQMSLSIPKSFLRSPQFSESNSSTKPYKMAQILLSDTFIVLALPLCAETDRSHRTPNFRWPQLNVTQYVFDPGQAPSGKSIHPAVWLYLPVKPTRHGAAPLAITTDFHLLATSTLHKSSASILTYLVTDNKTWTTNEVSPSKAVDREHSHHLHSTDVWFECTPAETRAPVHFKIHQCWATRWLSPCNNTYAF